MRGSRRSRRRSRARRWEACLLGQAARQRKCTHAKAQRDTRKHTEHVQRYVDKHPHGCARRRRLRATVCLPRRRAEEAIAGRRAPSERYERNVAQPAHPRPARFACTTTRCMCTAVAPRELVAVVRAEIDATSPLHGDGRTGRGACRDDARRGRKRRHTPAPNRITSALKRRAGVPEELFRGAWRLRVEVAGRGKGWEAGAVDAHGRKHARRACNHRAAQRSHSQNAQGGRPSSTRAAQPPPRRESDAPLHRTHEQGAGNAGEAKRGSAEQRSNVPAEATKITKPTRCIHRRAIPAI